MSKPRPPTKTGLPPITRFTLPACCAHYPGGPNGCACRLLRHSCGLPRSVGGSASASLLSRPAQASHTLRPAGSLDRPRRPSSRGFDPSDCSSKPLVSYQDNRQFPGWNLPPLVKCAFGAHNTNFFGYELSTQAFELCKTKESENVKYYLKNILEEDRSFDILLCIDVFEHVEDYIGFVKILKSKATYKIFHIPLDISVLSVLRDSMMSARQISGHLHYFTPATALATLK